MGHFTGPNSNIPKGTTQFPVCPSFAFMVLFIRPFSFLFIGSLGTFGQRWQHTFRPFSIWTWDFDPFRTLPSSHHIRRRVAFQDVAGPQEWLTHQHSCLSQFIVVFPYFAFSPTTSIASSSSSDASLFDCDCFSLLFDGRIIKIAAIT